MLVADRSANFPLSSARILWRSQSPHNGDDTIRVEPTDADAARQCEGVIRRSRSKSAFFMQASTPSAHRRRGQAHLIARFDERIVASGVLEGVGHRAHAQRLTQLSWPAAVLDQCSHYGRSQVREPLLVVQISLPAVNTGANSASAVRHGGPCRTAVRDGIPSPGSSMANAPWSTQGRIRGRLPGHWV